MKTGDFIETLGIAMIAVLGALLITVAFSGCVMAPRPMYPVQPMQWMQPMQFPQETSPGEQYQQAYLMGQGFRAGWR